MAGIEKVSKGNGSLQVYGRPSSSGLRLARERIDDGKYKNVIRGAGPVETLLRVMQVLRDAGDEKGVRWDLEHFVASLKDKVWVPLETVVEKEQPYQ